MTAIWKIGIAIVTEVIVKRVKIIVNTATAVVNRAVFPPALCC